MSFLYASKLSRLLEWFQILGMRSARGVSLGLRREEFLVGGCRVLLQG